MPKAIDHGAGLACTSCGGTNLAVKDSRPSAGVLPRVGTIRRARVCHDCGARFATLEYAESSITEAVNPAKVRRDICNQIIRAVTEVSD